MIGVVIRIFPNRGYGFVRDKEGVSRFFHAKDVYPRIHFDRMHEGQAVTFQPIDSGTIGNGRKAVLVSICLNR